MKLFTLSVLGAGLLALGACTKDKGTAAEADPTRPATPFTCSAPAESNDYALYKRAADGAGVGDVMPYYDAATNTTTVYYLKDVWNDAANQHHPWYAFTTNNFYSYQEAPAGELLASSRGTCAQDFALGTGHVVLRGGTYYALYTGHNPNSGGCTNQKEGIMLATASGLGQPFTKASSFATIYPPAGLSYDANDNFRDPFVYFDQASNQYLMLVTARKDVGGGNWKGVLASYTSPDLLNWSYRGVFYDGDSDNFFNLECASVFKLGSTYYLLFSDQGSQQVFYRKSSSLYGPWSKPSGASRLDGNGFYAPKLITDRYNDSYLLGWVNRQDNASDTGNRQWGGNLVTHKLYQLPNGDLAVTIPHTLKSYLETKSATLTVNARVGNVSGSGNTFTLASAAGSFINNVVFDPITAPRFKVSTTVNYSSASKDFGFMLGACDNYNGFYSLRFIPSQNRFSLDKLDRRNVSLTSVASTDVPFQLSPNTDYQVDIVEENSVVVVYLNNVAALTCRVYRAPRSSWGIYADNATATFKNVTVTTP